MAKEPVEKLNFIKGNSSKDNKNDLETKHLDHKELSQVNSFKQEEPTSDFFSQIKLPHFFNQKASDRKEENLIALASSKDNFNPNSISSIFSRDRQEATGINRVFKKSIRFI